MPTDTNPESQLPLPAINRNFWIYYHLNLPLALISPSYKFLLPPVYMHDYKTLFSPAVPPVPRKKPPALRRRTIFSPRPFIYRTSVSDNLSFILTSAKKDVKGGLKNLFVKKLSSSVFVLYKYHSFYFDYIMVYFVDFLLLKCCHTLLMANPRKLKTYF